MLNGSNFNELITYNEKYEALLAIDGFLAMVRAQYLEL
jgi:hypothetical protein